MGHFDVVGANEGEAVARGVDAPEAVPDGCEFEAKTAGRSEADAAAAGSAAAAAIVGPPACRSFASRSRWATMPSDRRRWTDWVGAALDDEDDGSDDDDVVDDSFLGGDDDAANDSFLGDDDRGDVDASFMTTGDGAARAEGDCETAPGETTPDEDF